MQPSFRSPWAIAASTLLLAACSSEAAPDRPQCPIETGPSFRVLLVGEGGSLPEDTEIEVTYGAGNEVYALGDATRAGKSVFCNPLPEDAGAGGVEAISCELWTSGAATIRVTALGYEAIEETLSAERDDCGIKLTEVERTLAREKLDGG